jgi:hypothetical protein
MKNLGMLLLHKDPWLLKAIVVRPKSRQTKKHAVVLFKFAPGGPTAYKQSRK